MERGGEHWQFIVSEPTPSIVGAKHQQIYGLFFLKHIQSKRI